MRFDAPSFLLDANRVNARQRCPASNFLERLYELGRIRLSYPLTAHREASRGGGNVKKRRAKLRDYPWDSATHGRNDDVLGTLAEILGPAHRNDIEICYVAFTRGLPLITTDGGSRTQPGGILGNAQALAKVGVLVMSPREAVRRLLRWRSSWPPLWNGMKFAMRRPAKVRHGATPSDIARRAGLEVVTRSCLGSSAAKRLRPCHSTSLSTARTRGPRGTLTSLRLQGGASRQVGGRSRCLCSTA